MPEKHKVYLAVPGPQLCWGTTTGVINSTREHEAYPYNMGFGFSGVEDFNLLWTDAHNRFAAGEVTHFAMLHGDITPDPGQCWLDILLEEMDARGASLVSAVSPIKDNRGLSSSGIADLNDHWKPFRRFTMREIHNELPETFDNAAAGYPGRPLLHNTGLWVCDLRRPCFQQANDQGELDLYFGFPTRAIRGGDGAWVHQRESEDWLLSRDLWNRGIKDTFITRRVRLTHHGKMDFPNWSDWGTFTDGDEATADKWRTELDALPLRMLQMLQFEIGGVCNLGVEHAACPTRHAERWANLDTSGTLSDEAIVNAAAEAYNSLGFTGMVGWAYYNEPLIEADRMFRLMESIKARAQAAKFILWTNGTLVPEDCERFSAFSQIIVSGYNAESARGRDRLIAKDVRCQWLENPKLDGRLHQIAPADPAKPCLRPFVEMVIDYHGNTHLCCYDWKGGGTWGNLRSTPFSELANRWRRTLPSISGKRMESWAPSVCCGCGSRWDQYQQHDAAIVSRARNWRLGQCGEQK